MIRSPLGKISSQWENVERVGSMHVRGGQYVPVLQLRDKEQAQRRGVMRFTFRGDKVNLAPFHDHSPLNEWDLFKAIRELAPAVARRTQEFDARQGLD